MGKTQNPVVRKVVFNASDSVYGYYIVIEPIDKKPDRLLVLLDGFGGNARDFLNETKIDEEAVQQSILTVCIPTGRNLYADSAMLSLLNKVIGKVITDYKISRERVAMGGFSSGGTIVLRYAECCWQDPAAYPVKPTVIFTGDSPVDLAGLYRSAKRELQKNFSGWWLNESRMIISMLSGSLLTEADWLAANPFNAADEKPGNEKYLANVHYRTYHDLDVAWQLENRGRSLYQVNALDASELISRLQLAGNRNAAFIQSPVQG